MCDESLKLYVPGQRKPRIVAIGGGHGLSTMLRGLKLYTPHLTAIVSVADDGGGSGVLREDLGMLPPGDIRNCILSLANTEPTMEKLLNYRFSEGQLAGQSFGNLFLAALNGISTSFDEAVRRMGEVLAISGQVLPVTNDSVYLEAEFENGQSILGESHIFRAKKENDCRIRKVRLVPNTPTALPASLEAIRKADMVILGPGSLYTSIIPNLLVDGIAQALAETPALRVLVLNLMTQDGETEGYTASDHVRALLAHGVPGMLDLCIGNNASISREMEAAYRAEGAEPLQMDLAALQAMGLQVALYPLATAATGYVRHEPASLAMALMEVLRKERRRT